MPSPNRALRTGMESVGEVYVIVHYAHVCYLIFIANLEYVEINGLSQGIHKVFVILCVNVHAHN